MEATSRREFFRQFVAKPQSRDLQNFQEIL